MSFIERSRWALFVAAVLALNLCAGVVDDVRLADEAASWTEMVTNPDPSLDSFSTAVWGALQDYDWTDLTTDVGFATIRHIKKN